MDSSVRNPFTDFLPPMDSVSMSHVLSKLMGYLLVFGSAIMKFPQIYTILKNRSVLGLNVYTFYFECAENLPFIIYNMVYVCSLIYRDV